MAEIAADPVRLEILWQRLLTILEEASWAIVRTSFSTAVREAKDFGCLLYDRKGQMVAQNVTTAVKIGVWHTVIPELLREYPEETLAEGDMFITNDPWLTEGHLYDTTVILPIFHGGHLVGYAECIAHFADIGGSMRTDATDLFEEGLQLPIVRIRQAGLDDKQVLRIFAGNVRTPTSCLGDLAALMAACDLITSKVGSFLVANGLDDLDELADAVISRTAAAMRAGIKSAVRPGTYTYEIRSDGYPVETTLAISITVSDSAVAIDCAGTSLQSQYGINCCWNYVYAWAAFALKAIVCPEGPINAGTFEPISLEAPVGSILNPNRGAPVRMRSATGQLIPHLVLGALSSGATRASMAESGSPLWIQRYFAVGDDGARTAEMTLCSGGTGARTDADGRSAQSFPSNAGNTPIEVLERALPLIFRERSLRPNSGGVGRHRGGLGQRVSFGIASGRSVRLMYQHERTQHAARGVEGGGDGAVGRTLINGENVGGFGEIWLSDRDEVELELPGGGGYGLPSQRDRDAVARDRAERLVLP